MECQEGATSNNSIGQHGIGDLDETGDVGAAYHETVDVVTGIVHLISLSKSGVCVSSFDSIHIYPSFVIPPSFHLCITFLTTSGNRPSNPNAIRICVICQGESTAPIPSSASVCRLGTAVPA